MNHVFNPLFLLFIGVFAPIWLTRADGVEENPSTNAPASPTTQLTQSEVQLIEGFHQERDLNGGERHF
ncbi:MAG: hypothetical protein HY774_22615 [Acidobacteria bacterium]|nr:hypothetical protein [Acidobacteriota bacterium]